jgi:hypothetical protein
LEGDLTAMPSDQSQDGVESDCPMKLDIESLLEICFSPTKKLNVLVNSDSTFWLILSYCYQKFKTKSTFCNGSNSMIVLANREMLNI